METASNASNNYISEDFSDSSMNEFNDYYQDDSSSMDSSYKRKIYNDYKNIDKGYHIVKLGNKNERFKISFYETSMIPGNMIRNALTGERYSNYRVGSTAEDLFYTVCYSIGNTGSRNPCILFFETPKDYEYMFRVKLSEKELEAWKSKMMYERDRRQELEYSQNKIVVK